MSVFDLEGRKALVTGGAKGLGAGMAEALAKAGASVMIGDVLEDEGRATAEAVGSGGVKTGFVKLDVTDDANWEEAVAATAETLGGFDILVNKQASRFPRWWSTSIRMTSAVCVRSTFSEQRSEPNTDCAACVRVA